MTAEQPPFESAESAIAVMITDGETNLTSLAQYWARLAVLSVKNLNLANHSNQIFNS